MPDDIAYLRKLSGIIDLCLKWQQRSRRAAKASRKAQKKNDLYQAARDESRAEFWDQAAAELELKLLDRSGL